MVYDEGGSGFGDGVVVVVVAAVMVISPQLYSVDTFMIPVTHEKLKHREIISQDNTARM